MKKYFIIFTSFLVLVVALSFGVGSAGLKVLPMVGSSSSSSSSSSGACSITETEDFSSGLGSWSADYSTWSIETERLRSTGVETVAMIRNTTSIGTTNQWACVEWYSMASLCNGSGVFLGATGATGYRYAIYTKEGGSSTSIAVFNTGAEDQLLVNESTTISTWATGDRICAMKAGSGSSPTFSVWRNPDPGGSTDCPDNWGAADATYGSLSVNNPADGSNTGIFSVPCTTTFDILDNFSSGSD